MKRVGSTLRAALIMLSRCGLANPAANLTIICVNRKDLRAVGLLIRWR